jgi:hypothetical protein
LYTEEDKAFDSLAHTFFLALMFFLFNVLLPFPFRSCSLPPEGIIFSPGIIKPFLPGNDTGAYLGNLFRPAQLMSDSKRPGRIFGESFSYLLPDISGWLGLLLLQWVIISVILSGRNIRFAESC